ncbi:regulator of chromosome condensation 1/beta-lactamase-inhibitor protein II [Pavlovales sp. CCMP2436]|nr:regulator of chromosome condensation 1/beta-lactamase-inhibitor protein II [Pavlovales sp. CCMP2436]
MHACELLALTDELIAHALGFLGADELAHTSCASRRLAGLADDALVLACHEVRIPTVATWSASRKLRYIEARARAVKAAPAIAAGHTHCGFILADGSTVVTHDGVAHAPQTDPSSSPNPSPSHAPCAAPRVRAPRLGQRRTSGSDDMPIAAVAAGDSFTIIVTVDGEVFAWGEPSDGALGLGLDPDAGRVRAPTSVAALSNERVVGVAAGFSHALFVTASGDVFSAGWGHGGRLGHGNADSSALPRRVSALAGGAAHVTAAFAGHSSDHSIVLDDEGRAWTFGAGRDGQLGHAARDASGAALAPERVLGALEALVVVGAAAGERHSLFLSSEGELFACGCADDGRLGLGDGREGGVLQPERVRFLPAGGGECARVVAVAAGARHSAAVGEDGGLWLWGELPAEWETAHADAEAAWGPVRVPSAPASRETVVVDRPRRCALLPPAVTAVAVSCGAGYTLVLGDDGNCYALGEPKAEDASSDGSEAEAVEVV